MNDNIIETLEMLRDHSGMVHTDRIKKETIEAIKERDAKIEHLEAEILFTNTVGVVRT